MRSFLVGLLALSLSPAAAMAQAAISPLNGFWQARPIERSVTGCDAELSALLNQMANVMESSAGSFEITWDGAGFNVDSLRRAQPAQETANWYQIADDLIVAIPPHRDARPAEAPVKVWLRLIAADTFESHITLDVTRLRELENQPIAPGTEACRLQVTTLFKHDI